MGVAAKDRRERKKLSRGCVGQGSGCEVADSSRSHSAYGRVGVICCFEQLRQPLVGGSAISAQIPDSGDDECTLDCRVAVGERVYEVRQGLRSEEAQGVGGVSGCCGMFGVFAQLSKCREGGESVCSKDGESFDGLGGPVLRIENVEESLLIVPESKRGQVLSPSGRLVTDPTKQRGYCVCPNEVNRDCLVRGVGQREPIGQRVTPVGWLTWFEDNEEEGADQNSACQKKEKGSGFGHEAILSARGAVERAN